MSASPGFRQIQPGFERLTPEAGPPRHAHFAAYATVILSGGYDQASYAGRMRLGAGDVLVQPTLDRHDSRMARGGGVHLLRLAWPWDGGLGGIYRLAEVEGVIRTAERDPDEAAALLARLVAAAPGPVARTETDWPDLMAADLATGRPGRIGAWAEAAGLAPESVSRGFARAFGVAPRAFAAELRARRAWLRIVDGGDSLAAIAADLGYADQPHMTRAVRALTGAPPNAWRRAFASNGFKTGDAGVAQMAG